MQLIIEIEDRTTYGDKQISYGRVVCEIDLFVLLGGRDTVLRSVHSHSLTYSLLIYCHDELLTSYSSDTATKRFQTITYCEFISIPLI